MRRCVDHSGYHFVVVYGVSNNLRSRWDNTNVKFLGYRPQDDSEVFAAEIFASGAKENEIAALFHGAHYCPMEFIEVIPRKSTKRVASDLLHGTQPTRCPSFDYPIGAVNSLRRRVPLATAIDGNHWPKHWQAIVRADHYHRNMLKSLVADAIAVEPVSTLKFPAYREINILGSVLR